MLTTSATLPISQGYIAQSESFAEMCERFCSEVAQNGFSYIRRDQQSEIYHTIQKFKLFSSNENTLSPITIIQWMQTLSRCLEGEILGHLLKETMHAMLVKQGVFNLKQCNLEQSIVILSKLDILLFTQALNQQLFSENDPTMWLTDVVPTLRVLILRCVAMGKNAPPLSPTQISTILSAMSRSPFILKNEEADAVFTVLAQHIQANTEQSRHFSDQELKNALSGLEYSQERESAALESLMQALLPPLLNAKMERPNDGVLTFVMYSLRYRRSNAITIVILEKATACINAYTTAQQWIASDCIAKIFAGLAYMGENTATEAFLIALLPHLEQLTVPGQQGGELAYHKIGKILEGLQYFENSKTALSILKEVTMQLAPLSHIESSAMTPEKWLANAIYSLSNYLDESASPEAQQCALALINKSVDILGLKPNLQQENLEFTAEELSNPVDRDYFIMKIGNFTNLWALEVDLSGYTCSRALLWFIAEFIEQLELLGKVEMPSIPRPVYFCYDDDIPSKKSWYHADEMQWTRAMFARFFKGEVEQDSSPAGSPLSLSSDASSASPAGQGPDEDVAAAAVL